MSLTQKQQNDIEVAEWFCPITFNGIRDDLSKEQQVIQDENGDTADKVFIDFSEKGIPWQKRKVVDSNRFYRLLAGKKYRGLMMRQWENGLIEVEKIQKKKKCFCSVSLWTLLGGEDKDEIPPRSVVDFMKKEIFKGKMKQLIEKTYQDVCQPLNKKG